MDNHEQFYDDEISPALAAIAQKCVERKIPFIAVVQFGPEPHNRGLTKVMTEDAGLPMAMLAHCEKTAPNIDAYMIGLQRYCAREGIDTSESIYMRRFTTITD